MSYQLVFDKKFEKIIREDTKYWTKDQDIPLEVINFINNFPYLFLDKDNNYYCPMCHFRLDKDLSCSKCHLHYENMVYRTIYIDSIFSLRDTTFDNYFYVFDTSGDKVILYVIGEYIYFDNPLTSYPRKTSKMDIIDAYLIMEDGYIELKNLKEEKFALMEKDIMEDNYIEDFLYPSYLYTDNLYLLENTIYRYGRIWEAKAYLAKIPVDILNLIYTPLYYKGFEYLMKKKFFSLAFSKPYLVSYDAKAKLLLDEKKGYLSFMRDNNFDHRMFMAFEMYPVCDINTIKIISDNLEILENISKLTNTKVDKIINYFRENNLDFEYLYEYFDYLEMGHSLGYDLKDKKIIFPKDLLSMHDKLYMEMTLINEPLLEERINTLSQVLSINAYEDDEYVIFPAATLDSLTKESGEMKNCVKTYSKPYSENKLQIYFLRKRDNVDKSFVTIEVVNGKIKQARGKYNESLTEDIWKVLRKWEKSLTKVING